VLTDVALVEVLGPVGDKGVGDDEDIQLSDQLALILRIGRVVPMIPLAVCTIDVCVCHFCLRWYCFTLDKASMPSYVSSNRSSMARTSCDIEAGVLFSTFPAAEAKRRSAPYLGLDEWHHEGFDRAILSMLVTYGLSEPLHEAKNGISYRNRVESM
jgi:hypothetical protein